MPREGEGPGSAVGTGPAGGHVTWGSCPRQARGDMDDLRR